MQFVRKLFVNHVPEIGQQLCVVSMDGVALHLTFGYAGKATKEKDEALDVAANSADDEPVDGGVRWDGVQAPRYRSSFTIVTRDLGVTDAVYTRVPNQVGDAIARHAKGKFVSKNPFVLLMIRF